MRAAIRNYLLVYLALLALVGLTVGTTFLDLGVGNPIANLGIAGVKALLITWFFMHLDRASGLARIAPVAMLLWLALMLMLTFADYVTRAAGSIH